VRIPPPFSDPSNSLFHPEEYPPPFLCRRRENGQASFLLSSCIRSPPTVSLTRFSTRRESRSSIFRQGEGSRPFFSPPPPLGAFQFYPPFCKEGRVLVFFRRGEEICSPPFFFLFLLLPLHVLWRIPRLCNKTNKFS